MDAADPTSNPSKVIVQCIDPQGLFEKVQPYLESRQSLGNLHWKSPIRPLRSIDRLNVSFTREEKEKDVPGGSRRHQIPGLRQTPFVKILLLRCDDKDTYKETTRKEVKQWLKSQGLSESGKTTVKGQERHDAYEYLILHVVFPNTPAASQPKSSKHISVDATESTESVNSKSKWTGKSSSTIYDKLRADFASSSKAPFERVAQIRILESATKQSSGLTPAENEDLWRDFVEKLKSAILGSFDARVAQYEDDIRERDSQRSLPGWNFCTFFLLKEGLARGFENIGLLEDALSMYDELDAGLDGIIQDQGIGRDVETAGTLLPFSEDLKPLIRSVLDDLQATAIDHKDLESDEIDLSSLLKFEEASSPLQTDGSDYRQRILTNRVSALDLRVYIFTNKLRLLLRRATKLVTGSKTRHIDDQEKAQYDIGAIADVMEQSLRFISLSTRALRQDLYAAWGGQDGLTDEELQSQETVLTHLTLSWKVSTTMQILRQCHVPNLFSEKLKIVSPRDFTSDTSSSERFSAGSIPSNGDKSGSRPTSSGTELSMETREYRQSTMISLQQLSPSRQDTRRNDGEERFALWVAELLTVARDVISKVSHDPGHLTTPAVEESIQEGNNNNGTSSAGTAKYGFPSSILSFVSSPPHTVTSIHQMLNKYIYQCYAIAKQTQASRQALLALAGTEVDNQSFDSAIRWLERCPDLVSLEACTITDLSILKLYIQCLANTQQDERYVKALLSMFRSCSGKLDSSAISSAGVDVQDYLNQLLSVSEKVTTCVFPFESLFKPPQMERTITYATQMDEFTLSGTLSLRVFANLELHQPSILKLVSTSAEPGEISLTNQKPISFRAGQALTDLKCNVSTHGWYDFENLVVAIGNLQFKYDFRSTVIEGDATKRLIKQSLWPILVYHEAGTISVEACRSPNTNITKTSHLRLKIQSRSRNIEEATVRIRPASAGARFDILAAELREEESPGQFESVRVDDGKAIGLRGLGRNSSVIVEVPYSLENALLDSVQVKIEIEYKTQDGTFIAFRVERFSTLLPIAVNVQDIFQLDCMFLRFTAGATTIFPIIIYDWKLQETDKYKVESGMPCSEPVDVFPRLPASWTVQLIDQVGNSDTSDKPLLNVRYQCLDETILRTMETVFMADITASPLAYASALMNSYLLNRVPLLWNEASLEASALLREFIFWDYEELEWQHVLQALHPGKRNEAEDWLRSWHQRHQRIELRPDDCPIHTLELPVDVPQPSVIVTTKLQLTTPNQDRITMNHLTAAEAIITSNHNTKDIEIHYEAASQSDAWLIGGRKRGILTASTQQTKIQLLLMPQRTGHLLLPSIDIRCRRPRDHEDKPPVTFEVDHQSQTQSVLVVSGLQSTTVMMGGGESREDYTVVDSRGRNGEGR